MAYLGREAAKAPIVTADLPDNGVSLAKMTGGTDGNIISYDASGNPVAIATGSDGQVLTSTGAGSPPAFEDAGGSTSASDLDSGTLATARMAAGTVIQTAYGTPQSGNSAATTSATLEKVLDASSNALWTAQLTGVLASSHVLIIMTIQAYSTNASNDEIGSGWGIMGRGSGGSTVIRNAGGWSNYVQNVGVEETTALYNQVTLMAMDTAPDTGTNDYYLAYNTQAGSTAYVAGNAASPFTCILMEIAQ